MSSPNLIPEQRRRQILDLLRSEPVKSYHELAQAIGVSHMTIRRDAATLAEHGRVRLTQGGIAAVHSMGVELPRGEKSAAHAPEKSAIVAAAVELVEDSMAVYLDAGTTIALMAPALRQRQDLTVVTNDLSTATAFLDHPGVELIMIGGRVDRANHSTIGRLAALALSELSLDCAFISCSSWDARHGLTTPIEAKIDPKRTAMAVAARSILLADSSKYGSFAKHRVAHLRELDTIITDDALEAEDADLVLATGCELVRAPIP
ncbi:DeoR/GlpR family DNA-binding transcription regulator [Brachybacterium hainanense]|uniref:DeoR/GlpR family DNA-binding transcription regulator n=1 Tax=Brachybacterium hainanense TaxID=1541174 RepID=A0ABV6R8C4_9MICO